MPKVKPLTDVENIPAFIQQVNSNFEKVEEALENTLSRDGSTPNEMNANLDMNGQNIINIGGVSFVGGPIFVTDAENILFDTPVGWIADNAQEGIEEAYKKASENAVRVDVAQSHSPSRKTQGRVNLGLGDLSIKNQISVPGDINATGAAHWWSFLAGDGAWRGQLGWAQIWWDVNASRSVGTSYQNTTGRPIFVSILGSSTTAQVSVDNSIWINVGLSGSDNSNHSAFVVPSNHYYRLSGGTKSAWAELI